MKRSTPPQTSTLRTVRVVAVAGRIMQLRDLGGAAFAHIEDESGRLQAWFRADRPGGAHAMVGLLDLGDIVGITGPMTRTQAR